MLKKLLILISITFLLACEQSDDIIKIVESELRFPPLNYTHEFDVCPMVLKFPGKPEIISEDSMGEQLKFVSHSHALEADCFRQPRLTELVIDKNIAAKSIIEEFLKEPIFKIGRIYELGIIGDDLIDAAQVKFIAQMAEPDEDYNYYGVIYIHKEYIAILSVLTKSEDIDFSNFQSFFENLKITPDPAVQ